MKYNFRRSKQIPIVSVKQDEYYIVTDDDGRIIDPSEITNKLKRLEYLEMVKSEISEINTRKTFDSELACLSCGDIFISNKSLPHFCVNCIEKEEDTKFKEWIKMFKDDNEIKIMKIVSYLYRLQRRG